MDVLTYTQQSVAFPTVKRDGVLDEVGLHLTGGEMWVEWSGKRPSLVLRCYDESLHLLLDHRVQDVLAAVHRLYKGAEYATPAMFIDLLDQQGAVPTHYHIQGLLNQEGLSLEDRAALERKLTPLMLEKGGD